MKKFVIFIVILITFGTQCFASEVLENNVSTSFSLLGNIDIKSDCVLMIERNSGEILYQKKAYEKMYPASTTKMLTAILVLEKCPLNEIVTVNASALNAVPPTYATAKLKAGEKFRVEDLLYALLIHSANDAANVLAEHVSGSISNYAEIMNKKAKEIGCENSHFTNPSGVHDTELYTTAYDLSLIARYAMNIEKFREIITTTTCTLPSTNIYPNADRTFTTSNDLINPDSDKYYYEYANGIKTGYTNPAKDCIVASAKKDDKEFIVVILGDGFNEDNLRQKYIDCKTLFDYAFANYIPANKNLQDKVKEFSSMFMQPQDDSTTDYGYLIFSYGSRIVAIIIIILSIRMLFVTIFKRDKNSKYKRKRKH